MVHDAVHGVTAGSNAGMVEFDSLVRWRVTKSAGCPLRLVPITGRECRRKVQEVPGATTPSNKEALSIACAGFYGVRSVQIRGADVVGQR